MELKIKATNSTQYGNGIVLWVVEAHDTDGPDDANKQPITRKRINLAEDKDLVIFHEALINGVRRRLRREGCMPAEIDAALQLVPALPEVKEKLRKQWKDLKEDLTRAPLKMGDHELTDTGNG